MFAPVQTYISFSPAPIPIGVGRRGRDCYRELLRIPLLRLSEKSKRVPRSWISKGPKRPNKAFWARPWRLTELAWASFTNFQTVSLGTWVNRLGGASSQEIHRGFIAAGYGCEK